MMRLLVACEESQRVCIAFREKGHEAYSCDIQECSGGHPEWHIKGDVMPFINGRCSFTTMDGQYHKIQDRWDMLIAHPPCTFMSNAGACRMYPQAGVLDEERFEKAMLGKMLFHAFLGADCEKICVENPRPMKIIGLPPPSCIVQPWEFGEDYSKMTYLWTKGLPPLMPLFCEGKHTPYLPSNTSQFAKGKGGSRGAVRGAKEYSKTFWGIARAMAEQWGDL